MTVGWRGKGIGAPVTMDVMKREFSKFIKLLFQSSAGQFHIQPVLGSIIFKVDIEGTDITPNDPAYVVWVRNRSETFFKKAFGPSVTVNVEGKLLAGSPQDGRPADQLIILPPLDLRNKGDDPSEKLIV